MDQRAGVGQLGLHEEHLDLLGIKDSGVAAHSLHLLELLHLSSRLDVLEVHKRNRRGVHDRPQVVVEALEGLEILE